MAVLTSHRLQRIGAEDVIDAEDGVKGLPESHGSLTPAVGEHASCKDTANMQPAQAADAASLQTSWFSDRFMRRAQDIVVSSGAGLITHVRAKVLIAMPAQEVRF